MVEYATAAGVGEEPRARRLWRVSRASRCCVGAPVAPLLSAVANTHHGVVSSSVLSEASCDGVRGSTRTPRVRLQGLKLRRPGKTRRRLQKSSSSQDSKRKHAQLVLRLLKKRCCNAASACCNLSGIHRAAAAKRHSSDRLSARHRSDHGPTLRRRPASSIGPRRRPR